MLCVQFHMTDDGGAQELGIRHLRYPKRHMNIERSRRAMCPVCNFDWHLAVIAGLIKIIDANPLDVCMLVYCQVW